jgi:hypothetical protein
VIVIDTGVLFGAADVTDQHHADCARILWRYGPELLIPAPVVIETGWMIGRRRDFSVVRPLHATHFEIIP